MREMINKIKIVRATVGMLVRGGWHEREDMRVELRELHEQKKRRSSVVLQGFNYADEDAAKLENLIYVYC